MVANILEGKVAIVTGGGSGIGRATSLLFAQAGARLVVADIAQETGSETVRMIRDSGGRAVFVKGDVTVAGDASRIVEAAINEYGNLNILANVAGGTRPPWHTVAELSEDKWDSVVDVNLKGVFLMCKYAIPRMIESGGGAIVNVGSGAMGGAVRSPAYAAAKAGIVGLTRSMAIDHTPQGIRVNAVSPGFVVTPAARRNRSPEEIAAFSKANLWGRAADPTEPAEAILFLASDKASYISGQILSLGGRP